MQEKALAMTVVLMSTKTRRREYLVSLAQDPLAMTTPVKMSSRIASATKDTQVVQAWVRACSARLERTKIWSTAMLLARHVTQLMRILWLVLTELIRCHRASIKVIAFALQDIMLLLEHLTIAST